MTNIATSLAVVQNRIVAACKRAKRPAEQVRLVAVTKKVDVERIREAASLGVRDFGENYVQEARRKIEAVKGDISWHMIGHLQTNKVKYIPPLFDYVHSIDRWELLEGLERYERELRVLFEIDFSNEPRKHGTTQEGLRSMLEKARDLTFVKPVGLMTMGPFTDDPEETRPVFRALRELLEEMNREFHLQMTELSMGMSSDFEVAIEEGATMVRVGTAIFGERA